MLFTLAAVIFIASIVVFFSQEFIRTFKKMYAIKGVALFFPLIVASWLVYTFDYWVLWAAYYCRELLGQDVIYITRILPWNQWVEEAALIILLTAVSVLPVVLLNFWSIRKTHKPYPYPYFTSSVIWIICAVLLTIF
ncbi:MAG: hypothetical protein P4L65_09005 [Legionella sp.]|nr:hypothetical protein [Legionella sp.]